MCQLLLEYYPDLLHHPDTEGATPLHYASLNGDVESVRFLLGQNSKMLKDNNGETPLHLACLNGHHAVVSLLLKAGADVNSVSEEGNTPLHLATINSQHNVCPTNTLLTCQVIRVLLSHPKIDRNIKTRSSNQTAYDLAVKGNVPNVLDAFDDVKRERVGEWFSFQFLHSSQNEKHRGGPF